MLMIFVFMVFLLMSAFSQAMHHQFILNLSSSVPLGVYFLNGSENYMRGDLVLFDVPDNAKSLIYGRGFLPEGWPLIKKIGALPGDRVCIDETLTINGTILGPVLKADNKSRALPQMRGCFSVAPGYFFPIATTARTIDGRYFGPVAINTIKGKATPIFIF